MSSDPSEYIENKYRLPTNIKPSHYDLAFWTDLKSLEFGGLVAIDLDIVEETSAIVLNCSKTLKLGDASIHCTALGTNAVQSAQIAIQENLGRNNDHTEYYALTHFQPIDARAAFPCWDEPLLKATWTITMISRADTVNISNMPAESEILYNPSSTTDTTLVGLLSTLPKDTQWKITKFQKSPPMSSYLVAFANGPLAYLERSVVMPLSGRSVPLRVYATPDIIDQGDFCLEITAKVLPLYEQMFDIEYPLPKLDILAAHDFDIGAMENWGLITGRTRAILLAPNTADLVSRKLVAKVISHEVAHMWFGNITTMQWWDNLYLNEGFASMIGEVTMLNRLFPEWEVKSSFVNGHLHRAMSVDAKRSSHPIEVECLDANFITQIFDDLSYSKAASVLRMLCEYVGEEQFLKGVSVYLKNHLYGNSATRDLWDGISAETGQDIPGLMNDWVSQIGFPVITVTENSNGIHLRQDRFLDSGSPQVNENEIIWNIPLRILTVENDGRVSIDKKAILTERENTLTVDTSKTFKLNAETTGFYRVLYTPERLEKIAIEAAKENSAFSLSDRIGLIYDAAALSKAGLAKISSFLALVDIWRSEPNYIVLMAVLTNMTEILRTFGENSQIEITLQAFIRVLYAPLVQRLGYEFPQGEPVDIVQLRRTAILGALMGRDESVIQELRSRFTVYLTTGSDSGIPSNTRIAIFKAAVRHGGREEFNALLKLVENPVNPALKNTAITAIGATENVDLIKELFSYMLNSVRDQDLDAFCRSLAANPLSRRLLAQFFKDNYDRFSERFGNSMLKNLFESCFEMLSTQEDYDGIEEFFKDKDTSRYSMAFAQVLEAIRSRIKYVERSSQDLSEWLTKWEQDCE
ncbi:leucyl aminopeptidase [Mycena alexandri]|uniref:Aminopeptidase n=1 Tax=Mycena alexandri TaxID=1745969 RepID=A0AAD6SED8_9AGAR|nr:leucyl aminopeptidase [Mycena alexandri]